VHVHDSDGLRDHLELGSAKVDFAGLATFFSLSLICN
jgi:hypothetical protein